MFRCCLLLLALLSANLRAASVEFTWQNPLPIGASGIDGLRDPFILREGGLRYMTGTGKPFFTLNYTKLGLPKGVPLYSSPDLKNWKFEGTILPRIDGAWYQDNFWAPEIHAKDIPAGRRYYVTCGCNQETKDIPANRRGIVLAAADKITGPYKVLTLGRPADRR